MVSIHYPWLSTLDVPAVTPGTNCYGPGTGGTPAAAAATRRSIPMVLKLLVSSIASRRRTPSRSRCAAHPFPGICARLARCHERLSPPLSPPCRRYIRSVDSLMIPIHRVHIHVRCPSHLRAHSQHTGARRIPAGSALAHILNSGRPGSIDTTPQLMIHMTPRSLQPKIRYEQDT